MTNHDRVAWKRGNDGTLAQYWDMDARCEDCVAVPKKPNSKVGLNNLFVGSRAKAERELYAALEEQAGLQPLASVQSNQPRQPMAVDRNARLKAGEWGQESSKEGVC